ncbi:HAD-IIB family hydrolase [Candidatus Saccharibacteria bacterium]|nr:HAD-IIB family hydrolase [Candidatus Saccharibacteria bacterium]
MKKLIAFDLDGTLAPSKSHFDPRMVALFNRLLATYQVCVISGAKYELFQRQFLAQITSETSLLERLHLMPTTGTRYYRFENGSWNLQYAEDFSSEDRTRIIKALEEGINETNSGVDKTYGPTIEDRGSQITLSPLGQEVVAELGDKGLEIKENWDPDMKIRMRIAAVVQQKIPDFNVKVAGLTSIDVTIPGVDKAYGMKKLMEANKLQKEDILFVGDKIVPGGNDYPVEEMGIDCISVRSWEDTAYTIEGIIGVA